MIVIPKLVSLVIEICAGNQYSDERGPNGETYPDWKVIDEATTMEEALAKFHSVRDYSLQELAIVSTFSDGSSTRQPVFGGDATHYKA